MQTNVRGKAKYIKIGGVQATNGAVYHYHPFQENKHMGLVSSEFIRPLTPQEKLEYAALTL